MYDDFVKVEDNGSDFATTIKWDETPEFIGTYKGKVTKSIRDEDRTFQQFVNEDGEEFEAWGTAILDSRLAKVPTGSRVKIVYLGKTAKTKRGVMAHNFDVFVARGSVPQGA